jgi:hypothetical protein
MVCDGVQGEPAWVSVAPGGDFEGAYVQSGRKGRYSVRTDFSALRSQGALASKLVKEFVANYDAIALTI